MKKKIATLYPWVYVEIEISEIHVYSHVWIETFTETK